MKIPENRSPAAKPISLAPLTPEEALRRAMQAKPAADKPKAPKAKKAKSAKKRVRR